MRKRNWSQRSPWRVPLRVAAVEELLHRSMGIGGSRTPLSGGATIEREATANEVYGGWAEEAAGGVCPPADLGAGGSAGRETRGVAQRPAGREIAEVFPAGQAERRGFNRLDSGQNSGDLLIQPADRTKHQQIHCGFGEHHPLVAERVDEGAGGGECCSAHVLGGGKGLSSLCTSWMFARPLGSNATLVE